MNVSFAHKYCCLAIPTVRVQELQDTKKQGSKQIEVGKILLGAFTNEITHIKSSDCELVDVSRALQGKAVLLHVEQGHNVEVSAHKSQVCH